MRRRRLQDVNDDAQEINLTPMLDVVFIMLIFFIVTTSFIKESGVEIDRPESSSATARPEAQVMVAITAEDAVWVDGQPVDAHRVGNEVASLVSDEGGVVIQADRQSTTGLLIEVMDAIRDAGVDNVAVAADRGADG
ncbi:ExbD/TolR family protein [Chromohalobacter sarecensis]|uniref:Outer membrane transport energization protein ExbD n=2 Tax=Chromohalobacter TaxID=42054 RepID=A0A285VRD6_9GAMM|nr:MULTISPECIES: biopolymer transporter ExbD [Chromohalobacter]MCK0714370.1 biopolymer transporter ExbD [Chromohalobacter sarecensis]MCT8468015.1 biopolymer transporter ExbD [Chromohalobacter canadensis]MCT8470236.1 biopolymer transporter ExbD [Chromohalobacter canadensis]MCT8498512.1 biopolymer transporter ExbD [Chromohalobacter canadensis]SOC56158.1 outer membrane transport energization protein ExbD [Chromohalobacter canadensis]